MNKKLKTIIIIMITILGILSISLAGYIIKGEELSNLPFLRQLGKQESIESESKTETSEKDIINEDNLDDYIFLYNGVELSKKAGVYDWNENVMPYNEKKYEVKYYNYEDNQYQGETVGILEKWYNMSGYAVSNVNKIAFSEKINAIPRKPKQVSKVNSNVKDYNSDSKFITYEIDLDGDGKDEYLEVEYYLNKIEGPGIESNNNEFYDEREYTKIRLLDSNCNFIALLLEHSSNMIVETDYTGNIDTIDFVDIDEDNIIEILIGIPEYEGLRVSIVKYNNGKLEGETNLKGEFIRRN